MSVEGQDNQALAYFAIAQIFIQTQNGEKLQQKMGTKNKQSSTYSGSKKNNCFLKHL